MPAATRITKKVKSFRGVALTEVTADQIDKTNGNVFANLVNNTEAVVHNAHATEAISVVVVTPGVVAPPGSAGSPLTVEDVTVSVAAGATKVIGPFSKDFQDANGDVTLTYSGTPAVTDVHINVLDAPSW